MDMKFAVTSIYNIVTLINYYNGINMIGNIIIKFK